MEPTAQTDEELQFLDDIVICSSSDGTSRLFINNSDVVWYFTAAETGESGNYVPYPTDDGSERFRDEIAPSLATYAYMAPDDQVVAVYRTLEDAESTQWYIDRKLSTALALQTIFEDRVEALTQSTVVRLFAQGSAARKAVAACAVAGVNAGVLVGENDVGFNADTLGAIAGEASCASAWLTAEQANSEIRFPKVTAAVGSAAEVGEHASFWAKIGEYAQLGCRIMPRGC
ncbi:hypothetical protein [Cryobacterium serini]|uniref:hypothetical protein n=1 Tax=Cryobacterium serini TaxID=1259201 RepID=UPI00141AB5BD|nr:hypothetical protein [Cryobacterium serini]